MLRSLNYKIICGFVAFVVRPQMCFQIGQSLEGRLDTPKRGLLKYAVFFCTEFESVYT